MAIFPHEETIEFNGCCRETNGGGDLELTLNNDGTIGICCTDTYDCFSIISREDAKKMAKWILEVTEEPQ